MTYKKSRAGLSAMLLYSQLMLLFFVVDVAIVKEASISKVTVPLALQEMALLLLMIAITFVGYYLIPMTKKRIYYLGAISAVEVLFWIVSAATMGFKKVLGFKELMFIILQCLLIAACCAGMYFFEPKKEKGRWLSVCIVESACVVAMFGSSVYVALRYRNELISAGINIVMFALCAACMLVYWWFADEINHWVSVAVVVGQAITFIYCFSALCRKKEMTSLLELAYRFISKKEPAHILTWTALILAFLLALAMLLHYLKNLQIVGKYTSVVLSCMILLMVFSAAHIQKNTSNAVGINADEATQYEEYCLYVLNNDAAQKGSEIAGYTVGYSSNGREKAMASALEKLHANIGVDFQTKEYDSYEELAEAIYSGEVKAVFFESIFADMIELETDNPEVQYVFIDDARVIERVQIEFIEEDPEPIDPDDPDYPDDPSATPTLPQGVTPTPTPSLAPGVSATPTPKKSAPTPAGPTPTTMPKVPRKDNSNKDLTKESFIVYISGIDRYGDVSVRSRSDVNLLLAINPRTKKITMVTTPRDAYVHIPGKTSSQRDKLTHAGLYGVDYSMATLENLYGIEIDFYVRLNFSSMIKIINLLGGVDVESLYEFTTYSGGLHFPKGLIHLDGSTALLFARERKGVPGGDVTRGKHQMEVLKGIINKLTSPSVLSKYQSLISSISTCTQTDITFQQLVSLATMQLGDGAKWSVSSYNTTGSSSYQYCYSYRGKKLWVSLLNQASINKASSVLKDTLK